MVMCRPFSSKQVVLTKIPWFFIEQCRPIPVEAESDNTAITSINAVICSG